METERGAHDEDSFDDFEGVDDDYALSAHVYPDETQSADHSGESFGQTEDTPKLETSTKISPPGTHTVRAGESLSSIAALYRLTQDRVWEDPSNADLRDKRSPGILHPGDEVFIPQKDTRTENRDTDRRHRFRRKAEKAWIRIVLQDEEGNPRRNVDYVLHVDGVSEPFEGATTSEGLIEAQVPVTARTGILNLRSDESTDEWEVLRIYIGHLDPIEEKTGIEARLNSLGYRVGAVDGAGGLSTEAAISAFQVDQELAVTGELDEQTKDALRKAYGC